MIAFGMHTRGKHTRLNVCLSVLFFALAQLLSLAEALSCQVEAKQPHKIQFSGGTMSILPGAVLTQSDVENVGSMSHLEIIESQGPIVDEGTLIDLVESVEGLKSLAVSGPAVTDKLIRACSKKNTLQSLYLSGPLDGSGLTSFVDKPIAKSLKQLGLTTEPFLQGGALFGEVYGLSEKALQAIVQLDGIEELYLNGCGLNDKNLETIAKLSGLQTLSLDANPILGSGLKRFSGHERLKVISASYCRISDLHLDEFPGLRKLQTLDLRGNPIGDIALKRISSVLLPDLRRLLLGGTRITDVGLSHLSGFPSLQDLELNNRAVTGRQLSALKNLPIRWLDLSRTACHSEIAGSLLQLKSLRSLMLSETKLKGSDLEGLAEHEELAYLNLAGTQIKAQSLESLKRKLDGVEVDLKHPYGDVRKLIPGGRESIEQR